MLNRKCEDLNQNLIETNRQRDQERSEINKLNDKLRQLQVDTERVVRTLKGMQKMHLDLQKTLYHFFFLFVPLFLPDKCKQNEEKEAEVMRFTKMYEMLLLDKDHIECELKGLFQICMFQ